MPVIASIRFYRSQTENADGCSLPESFDNKPLHLIARRITMKLNENGFSLGDFDHLYINLTTCPVPGGYAPAKRSPSRETAWLRYYDVQVHNELYHALHTPACHAPVIHLLERVLIQYFQTPTFSADFIHQCIAEATQQGGYMLMRFKEKATAKRKAVLYLRLLDSGTFFPLLRVWDMDDHLLLESDLPEMTSLDRLGELQVGLKKVTVKPRKSSYTDGLEPLVYEY